jgi:hypothetical protein
MFDVNLNTIGGVFMGQRNPYVVEQLCFKLESLYVFPVVAAELKLHLEQQLNKGVYDAITEPTALATALTCAMFEISGDRHLRVAYNRDESPSLDDESMDLTNDILDGMRGDCEEDNFGFYKTERLRGNIGYLDVRYLAPAEIAGNTAIAAMNFISNTSALIIDVRSNRGGVPSMVDLICGYLFRPSVQIDSLYWRKEEKIEQHWSFSHVPGKHYGNKPVYLLISGSTFSGAEELAYSLKQYRRATLVGERTMGGAHPGRSVRLTSDFTAFIPMGRAVHPLTGGNWEGTGVDPDVTVAASEAMNHAYALALGELIGKPDIAQSLRHECEGALLDVQSGAPLCNT